MTARFASTSSRASFDDERAEVELMAQVKSLVGAFQDLRPVYVPYGLNVGTARTDNALEAATSATSDLGVGNLTAALNRVINGLAAATHTRHDGVDYLFADEAVAAIAPTWWNRLSCIRVRDDNDFEPPWTQG